MNNKIKLKYNMEYLNRAKINKIIIFYRLNKQKELIRKKTKKIMIKMSKESIKKMILRNKYNLNSTTIIIKLIIDFFY